MADFNLRNACDLFHKFTGAKPFGRVFLSGRGKEGLVARLFKDKTGKEFCVVFKREFYRDFGSHFKSLPSNCQGYGQIVSHEMLKRLNDLSIDNLVVVMPQDNGYVGYIASIKRILDFYAKYQTDVPHLEGEIAFPSGFLVRYFPQRGITVD